MTETAKAAAPKKPTRAEVAAYNSKVFDAYSEEFEQAQADAQSDDPAVRAKTAAVCSNASGSVLSKCLCPHCRASRASSKKQTELTGYDPSKPQ